MALRSEELAHRLVGIGTQPALRQEARDEQQQQRSDGHEDQHAADEPEDDEEKQEERDIDQRGDRGRGQHVAHLLEVAQLGDEAAGRGRAGAVAHPQGVAEDLVGHADIGALAEDIDDGGAGVPHQEIEDEGEQHAGEQHVERGQRFRRHDAIVDLHGKDHAGEAEHVGDERGEDDVQVGPQVAEQDAAQPALPMGRI